LVYRTRRQLDAVLVWYPAYSAHKSTYNVMARAGKPG